MIISKSTSHCGITIAIGAKETPLSHSVKPQVVRYTIMHTRICGENFVQKEPSYHSQPHEQMHHIIPQESTRSGRPVTTGLDLVQ
jgi:hypothetical protein